MKFDYCDVILKRDGSITVKFLDLNNKIVYNKNEGVDQLKEELDLIKNNLRTRIKPLIQNKYNLNIDSLVINNDNTLPL